MGNNSLSRGIGGYAKIEKSYSHLKHLRDMEIQKRAMTDMMISGISMSSADDPRDAAFNNFIPCVSGKISAIF